MLGEINSLDKGREKNITTKAINERLKFSANEEQILTKKCIFDYIDRNSKIGLKITTAIVTKAAKNSRHFR